MGDDPWLPTSQLTYYAGILQQRWTRRRYEYRSYGGQQRRSEWYEEEWRDVPTRSPDQTSGGT